MTSGLSFSRSQKKGSFLVWPASVIWCGISGALGGLASANIVHRTKIKVEPAKRLKDIRPESSNGPFQNASARSRSVRSPCPNVSFDALRFTAIAFPPQILVRWLSGRKRRFAKALYLKRVPRVRIPASPLYLSAFPLDLRGLRERALRCRRRRLAKLDEP